MNLRNYILNLQQRPVQERKRIAVIATAVSFFIILLIWVISFKEMNKGVDIETDPAAASLNDLKNNFETGKDSIQNMMQELPSQNLPAGEAGESAGTDNNAGNPMPAPSTDSIQNMDNNNPIESNSSSQQENSFPQLP